VYSELGKKEKVRVVAYFETVLRNVTARHRQISKSPGLTLCDWANRVKQSTKRK